MSSATSIEWADATWNPVTGCTKVSPGCDHCYAETFAERFRGVAGHPYEQGFDLKLWPDRLGLPLTWSRPKRIFVNSMSDLFHARVPFEFVQQVWNVMRKAHWHTFLILTKRPDRMARFSERLPLAINVWLGTSVEDQVRANQRMPRLERSWAAVRFVSAEPLLGPVDLTPWLQEGRLDQVIVGGESGPHARPMELDWARSLRDQCRDAGVSFFLKQLGGYPDKRGHDQAVLDGRRWHEYPHESSDPKEVMPLIT